MNKEDLTNPPALDHDAMMVREFGPSNKLDQRQRNERSIVWNLCRHLRKQGFEVKAVYDGEGYTKVSDVLAAMELIFNLDEASLRVEKPGFSEHGILLILGNGNDGLDMIADYSYTNGDPDGFNAAMEAFNVGELYS